ncbi:hypothetical protein CDCA_CDCA14G3768 [Cyanidium caldarium]|uniref:50S ribosomal protein L35 n=1 Tax=Cyanidium caldarium TaxID=2771 RepID=A0AAV9J079_CYACA|nr:hypothetical protein CDCA_CDCA14G3768 [Cyanidium caldarium]
MLAVKVLPGAPVGLAILPSAPSAPRSPGRCVLPSTTCAAVTAPLRFLSCVPGKTHKGARKRFHVRADGSVWHAARGHRHYLSNKLPRQRRRLKRLRSLGGRDAAKILRMLGR